MSQKSEKEQTIPFTLDNLDFEPNAFFGFTSKEFIVCIGAQTVGYSILLVPIAKLAFGVGMFGFVGAGFLAVCLSILFAQIATTKKKGRPSYMLWVDIKKHIQFNGVVFGLLKMPFGFIGTTKWDVISETNKGQLSSTNWIDIKTPFGSDEADNCDEINERNR
jgi:conjugative transfer region protein (TIGR03750 family)